MNRSAIGKASDGDRLFDAAGIGSFAAIHMLAGSRYVHFTAEFVRRFSELEKLMRVHTSEADFDAALAASESG